MDVDHPTLAAVAPGRFLCARLDPVAGAERMKSLGICVGRPLELLSSGDPMILRVCGTSIGLSRQLAAAVRVTPLAETAPATPASPLLATSVNG